MSDSFVAGVRKPIEFVVEVLRHFARDSSLSLEGDLSLFDRSLGLAASFEPNDLHRRSTIAPLLEIVVIPISETAFDAVTRQVLPRVGLRSRIVHVRIASEGRVVLGAFDSFADDCVWVDTRIGADAMERLLSEGVIDWYRRQDG